MDLGGTDRQQSVEERLRFRRGEQKEGGEGGWCILKTQQMDDQYWKTGSGEPGKGGTEAGAKFCDSAAYPVRNVWGSVVDL